MDYKIEPIKGFEEYQIDTDGIVYGKNGIAMTYSLNPKGYCMVQLRKDGKVVGKGVHSLVALQFLPNPEGKTQVNHIDGDKTNNSVSNLEWVTPKENMAHAKDVLGISNEGVNNNNSTGVIGRDKKTGEIIYDVECIMDAAKEISKISGTSPRYVQNGIWKALKGIRKTYKGCAWEYK